MSIHQGDHAQPRDEFIPGEKVTVRGLGGLWRVADFYPDQGRFTSVSIVQIGTDLTLEVFQGEFDTLTPFGIVPPAPEPVPVPSDKDLIRLVTPARSNRRPFSDDQVRSIRARHATGETLVALARFYGSKAGTISSVVRGITYKDVI